MAIRLSLLGKNPNLLQ